MLAVAAQREAANRKEKRNNLPLEWFQLRGGRAACGFPQSWHVEAIIVSTCASKISCCVGWNPSGKLRTVNSDGPSGGV